MLVTANHNRHLYFEKRTSSKEYALDKCMKVLALIARLQDRNETLKSDCIAAYGKDFAGRIICTAMNREDYRKNLYLIKRLKGYYNLLIQRLQKF